MMNISTRMAELGALVAEVAHEVRNPLFALTSAVDAFEARSRHRPEDAPFLCVIRETVDRLSDLMLDLLEYGRPEGVELAPGPLPPVIEEGVRACRLGAEERGVALDCRFDDGLPPVNMNPRRLAQVFRNLVENAVQHSQGAPVTIEATAGPDRVVCRVRDRGPGFAASDLPHVFEPFYTRRDGGTGLGLAIVSRIVTEHQGTVRATNAAGGGGVVIVEIPV